MSSEERQIPDGTASLAQILDKIRREASIDKLSTIIGKDGIRYYVGGIQLTEENIEKLVQRGVLVQSGFISMITCPNCESYTVAVMPTCPRCGSNDVELTELVAHVKCGYIGLSRDFKKSGKYICPGCGETINEISELRMFGRIFVCHNCGARFDMPQLKFRCLNCNQIFDLKSIRVKRVPTYAINRTMLQETVTIFLSEDIGRILQDLATKLEASYEYNFEIRGLSGLKHTIPYVIKLNSRSICVFPIFNEKDITRLSSLILDLPESFEIIVLCHEDSLKTLGMSCDSLSFKGTVKLVKFSTISELRDKVVELIQSLVKESKHEQVQDQQQSPS